MLKILDISILLTSKILLILLKIHHINYLLHLKGIGKYVII